ncbi:hypothetical protein E2P61_03555 [Candidatus Bathyarchaeota archaeon]|nr:hypothetical protein E2P61_03555 [Candidatus Bathyarchaeota archaeon]
MMSIMSVLNSGGISILTFELLLNLIAYFVYSSPCPGIPHKTGFNIAENEEKMPKIQSRTEKS